MNNGMYGYGLPPNFATRVAPAKWTNYLFFPIAGTYTGITVPQNVYQMGVAVWGGGGSGAFTNSDTKQATDIW
jgi:hypothetical protein